MGTVAIYIGHGVEVRHFVLCGLVDEIRKNSNVVLLVRDIIDSPVLDNYIKTYQLAVIKIHEPHLSKKALFAERIVRSVRDSRKRSQKLGIYRHMGIVGEGNQFIDFIKGNRLVHYLSDSFGRKYIMKQCYILDYEKILKQHNINTIYFLDYGSAMAKILGSISAQNNIKVNLFINTLKSVFINDFVPFPVNSLNAWNNLQKKLYSSANPGLNKNNIVATGTPFHTFLRKENDDKIKQVRLKYNLPRTRPVIVYSLIFEKVFEKEHLILEMLNDYFENNFNKEECPVIVIRRNPFEENDLGIKYLSLLKNIVIADHYWERDAAKVWSIQGLEGELEWRALLQMSSLSMNIPSMSTIDSLMCGTPVVNIGFDECGQENQAISNIIYAPFVAEFEKSNFVNTFTSYKSFKNNVKKLIPMKYKSSKEEIQNSIDISLSDLDGYDYEFLNKLNA